MKQINSDIKNNTFKNVYLIYGPESYLRLLYTKKLCDAVLPESDNMNRVSFDGKNTQESAIIEFAETLPFFAGHRLVRVKDSGFFKGAVKQLPDYIPRMSEHAVIVFCETEVDKRCRLYKAVQKHGYVAEFALQNKAQLMKWGTGLITDAGMRITAPDMEYLLSRTGPDMTHLSLEIDKVISYCQGRDTVTRQDIEAVTGTQIENHIFDMLDAIAAKNRKKAFDLYSDLLALKEPPLKILFMIERQFNQLLMVKELMAEGEPVPAIAQKTSVRDFVIKRSANMLKSYTVEDLYSCVGSCLEMEKAVKTGNIGDRISVEIILAKLSS